MKPLRDDILVELAAECRRLFPGLVMTPNNGGLSGKDHPVAGRLGLRDDDLMQLRFVIDEPLPSASDHVFWTQWRPGRLADDVAAMERFRVELVDLHHRLGLLLGVSDG